MATKLIVFDIAGTTVTDDNFVGNAFKSAFENHHVQVALADVNPLMGYEKKSAIRMILEKYGVEFQEELIDTIYQDFIEEMIEFYEFSPDVKAMPGAEELFRLLKERSITVTLNTGFSRNIADTILKRFQWVEKGLVDDFIASDEVKQGRPYPFMIEQLMYRAGVDDPMRVAKVGDTKVDIEEGKNVGCRYNIAIVSGVSTFQELESSGPTHIVNKLMEIFPILH